MNKGEKKKQSMKKSEKTIKHDEKERKNTEQ